MPGQPGTPILGGGFSGPVSWFTEGLDRGTGPALLPGDRSTGTPPYSPQNVPPGWTAKRQCGHC